MLMCSRSLQEKAAMVRVSSAFGCTIHGVLNAVCVCVPLGDNNSWSAGILK